MRDVARIPIRSPRMAAALRAIGVRVVADVALYERQGKKIGRWWVEGAATQEVMVLLGQMQDKRQPLAVTQPEHALLACLYALEARETIRAWQEGAQAPRWIRTPGRLMRLVGTGEAAGAADVMAEYWPGKRPAVKLATVAHAAAAAVCGIPVWPRLMADGTLAAAGESITMPGLIWEVIRRVCVPVRTEGLPGHGVGEHPWDYAMAAMQQEDRLPEAEARAGRNPTVFFSGKRTAGALATLKLLESKDSRFRDRLLHHLR